MARPEYTDGEYTGEVVAPFDAGNLDSSKPEVEPQQGARNWQRFVSEFPQYNNDDFVDFVHQHNKADRDSGELDQIPFDELKRLLADYLRAQKAIPDTAGTPTYYLDPNALYTYTSTGDPARDREIYEYGVKAFKDYLARGLDNITAEKQVIRLLQVEFALDYMTAFSIIWPYLGEWDKFQDRMMGIDEEGELFDTHKNYDDPGGTMFADMPLPPWWESRLRNMNPLYGSFKFTDAIQDDQQKNNRMPFERLDLHKWTDPNLRDQRIEQGDQLCYCDLLPDAHPVGAHEDTWSLDFNSHPHMYEEQYEMNTVGKVSEWIEPNLQGDIPFLTTAAWYDEIEDLDRRDNVWEYEGTMGGRIPFLIPKDGSEVLMGQVGDHHQFVYQRYQITDPGDNYIQGDVNFGISLDGRIELNINPVIQATYPQLIPEIKELANLAVREYAVQHYHFSKKRQADIQQHEIEDTSIYNEDLHVWTDDSLPRLKEKDNLNEELIPNDIAQWMKDNGEVAFVYMNGELYWGHNIQDIVAREFTHVPNLEAIPMVSGILNVYNETVRIDDSYGYNRDYGLVNSLMNKLKMTLELPRLRALDPEPEVEPDDFRSNEEIYKVKDHIMGSTKESMPYHVSPRTNRPEIEEHGLIDYNDVGGIYYWDTEDQARAYPKWLYSLFPEHARPESDIWQFDLPPETANPYVDEFLQDDVERSNKMFNDLDTAPLYHPNGEFGGKFAPGVRRIPPEQLNRLGAGYNPSVNNYNTETWDHNFWWHSPKAYYDSGFDEATLTAGKILWKADQFLEKYYQDFTVRSFNSYVYNTVIKEIKDAWNQLPADYDPDPGAATWQNFPKENEQFSLDTMYYDKNEFYRNMDYDNIMEKTDLLWNWRSYWTERIAEAETFKKIKMFVLPDVGREIYELQHWFTDIFHYLPLSNTDPDYLPEQDLNIVIASIYRIESAAQRIENELATAREGLFDHYYGISGDARQNIYNRTTSFISAIGDISAKAYYVKYLIQKADQAILIETNVSHVSLAHISAAFDYFQELQNDIDQWDNLRFV